MKTTPDRLARTVLVAFLFTFSISRILVYLMMSRRMPDLYAHIGGTHIHHLNYGIFLLAGVGGYLLFADPDGRALRPAAAVYGIGLALTFDEFGMWLHLNDFYWQRASFDAITVIMAALALMVVLPRWRSLRGHHWAAGAALALTLAVFAFLLYDSLRYADTRLAPFFERLQQGAPR